MTDVPFIGHVTAPALHVMSYNIRRRMTHPLVRSPDRWDGRRDALARLLLAEQPTILGVQEALPDQAGFVRHALGQRYRSIGYGRQANHRGEGCPLFYDRERLELLEWTQTALSDTPDVAGSTTWGNPTPRVIIDAHFRDRDTSAEFRALNTHFDQFSRRSRMSSADALLRLIAVSPLPAFVTGDFNTDAETLPHERLVHSGALRDSWEDPATRISDSWGTFPNYKDPKLERKRIDWILVTPAVTVVRTGINVARFDDRWPSDHTPVQAELRIGAV